MMLIKLTKDEHNLLTHIVEKEDIEIEKHERGGIFSPAICIGDIDEYGSCIDISLIFDYKFEGLECGKAYIIEDVLNNCEVTD